MSDGGDDEGDVTTLVSAMTGPQSFKRPEAAYAVVKHQPRQLVTTETRTRAYMILHLTYTDECTYIYALQTQIQIQKLHWGTSTAKTYIPNSQQYPL